MNEINAPAFDEKLNSEECSCIAFTPHVFREVSRYQTIECEHDLRYPLSHKRSSYRINQKTLLSCFGPICIKT